MVVQARLDEEKDWRELKDWRLTAHAGSPWNRCDEPGFGREDAAYVDIDRVLQSSEEKPER